jgi:hypothetical protein
VEYVTNKSVDKKLGRISVGMLYAILVRVSNVSFVGKRMDGLKYNLVVVLSHSIIKHKSRPIRMHFIYENFQF